MGEPPLGPLSHPPASPAQHGICLQWTNGRPGGGRADAVTAQDAMPTSLCSAAHSDALAGCALGQLLGGRVDCVLFCTDGTMSDLAVLGRWRPRRGR